MLVWSIFVQTSCMFEDDEEATGDNQLSSDLELFEAHLTGSDLGFIDSDRMEGIIDHYFSLQDFKKAKRAAQIAETNFTYNPIFRLRIVQALCGEKNYALALETLSRVNVEGVSPFELWVTYGSIYSQMNQPKLAVEYFLRAFPYAELDDLEDLCLDISHAYVKLDDREKSLAILEKGLEHLPNCESLLYELGFTYDRVGNHEKAIATYLKYLDDNPYASMAWYNLGNSYSKLENYTKAIWAYDYCLLIIHDFSPAHFNLGNAYLSSGKHHRAIASFQKVLELEGDDPMALCYLGEAHEQLQEYEIALNYYRLSLEIQPNLYEAWLGLGIVVDLLGNTREALAHLLKARNYAEGNASVSLVLANAYHKLQDRALAEECYQEAIELDSCDTEALHDYVIFLLEDSPLLALAYLEQHQETLEKNEYFLLMLVHILVHLARNEDALFLFSALKEQSTTLAEKVFEWNPKLRKNKDFVSLMND
ncbi:MAG: tetratricopeptide repeat protein [Bacteroidetes bacterium]|nr:tetratricopeptide repeat protein [Bacteroidota bacterium]